jgi:FMN phosphatase YigB (HAD superfamily)
MIQDTQQESRSRSFTEAKEKARHDQRTATGQKKRTAAAIQERKKRRQPQPPPEIYHSLLKLFHPVPKLGAEHEHTE